MSTKKIVAAAVVAGVLALTACSSSKGSGTATTAPPASGSSSSASAPSASTSTSAAASLIETRLKDFTAHTSPLTITDPVKVPAKKLTFAYLQCIQAVCKEIGDGLQQAADAIGAKLLRITHMDTAATVQQAAVNALQQNPDAVFFSGDPSVWLQAQLDEMNAKKIPVITWSEPGGFTPPGITANLLNGDDYYFIGVLEADWVASKSAPDAHFLLDNVPTYPVLATAGQGFTDEMKTACPGCTIVTDNYGIPDLVAGKNVSGNVASLQRDPKITYIVGTFGGLITQPLQQAVQAAGFTKVKAISASGTASNYQLIQSGNFQEADLALPSGFLAWRVVDAALRALAGLPINQSSARPASANIGGHPDILAGAVPQEFVTKTDMPSGTVTSVDQLWTPSPNFQATFKTLWGIN